ncbi:MAG TPA: alpha/beta hydrolase-fold protein [Bacteroidales bacterium]|nr:alpha/beta hydrolase-fold protein [Bacteroidales bacterium]
MTKSKIDKITIHSKCLGKEMNVLVYLPYDYDKKENLTTLYFLHGRSGDENILIEAGINIVADRLIANQEIESMIIVCPNIENSRGLNSSFNCKEVRDPLGRIINIGMYEDYLIREVIPEIDNRYNTNRNRNGRYIGGASAGGYAALHNAFRHYDLFSKVGGHMPAIELKLEDEDKAYFQNQDIWEKYDPITIAQQMKSCDLKVYLDAGDKDEGRFYEGCLILNKILNEKGIDSQNHVFEGCHSLEYIKSNFEKYMFFYGKK